MAESHFLYSYPGQLGSSKRRESTFFKVPNLSTIHSVNLSNVGETTIVQASGKPESKSQRQISSDPTAQLCQGDFVQVKPTKNSIPKNSNYAFNDSFGARLARRGRESSYVAGREHSPNAGRTRLQNKHEVTPTKECPARSSIPKQHAKVGIQESTMINQSNSPFNKSNKQSMFVQNASIRNEELTVKKCAIRNKNAHFETDDQRWCVENCNIQENVEDLAPKTKITVVQHPEKMIVDTRSQFCFPTNCWMKRGSEYFENNRGAKSQPIRQQMVPQQMAISTPTSPVVDEAYETALEDQPSERVIRAGGESRYCYKMPRINKCSEQVVEDDYHPKPPRTITKPTQAAHRSTDQIVSSPDAKFHYINNRLNWLNHRDPVSAKDHNEPETRQFPFDVIANENNKPSQQDVQQDLAQNNVVGNFEEEQYIEAIEKAKNQNFRSQFCGHGFSGLLRNRGSEYAADLCPIDISNQFPQRLNENQCYQQQHAMKITSNSPENHMHMDEDNYSPNDERSGYVFLQNNVKPQVKQRLDVPKGPTLKQGTKYPINITRQHEACQCANDQALPAEQANMLNFNGAENDLRWAQDRLPIPVMPKESGYMFQNIEQTADVVNIRPVSRNPSKPGLQTRSHERKVGMKAGSKQAEMNSEQVEDNQIHDHNADELESDSTSSVKYSQYLFRNKNHQVSKNCGKATSSQMKQQNNKPDIKATNSEKSSESGSRSHNSVPMPMDFLKREHKEPMSKFLMDYNEADYSTNTLVQLDRCSPFPKETARGVAEEARTSGDFKTIGTKKKESLRVSSNNSDLKPKITVVNMKKNSNSSDHKCNLGYCDETSKPTNQNSANVNPMITKKSPHLPFQPQRGLDQHHGFADPYWPLLQNSPFVPPPFWNQPMTPCPGRFYPMQMYHPHVNAQMNWNPHIMEGYDSSETTESDTMPGRMEPKT